MYLLVPITLTNWYYFLVRDLAIDLALAVCY